MSNTRPDYSIVCWRHVRNVVWKEDGKKHHTEFLLIDKSRAIDMFPERRTGEDDEDRGEPFMNAIQAAEDGVILSFDVDVNGVVAGMFNEFMYRPDGTWIEPPEEFTKAMKECAKNGGEIIRS